jgi:heme-degrading monooxygenase HmoA
MSACPREEARTKMNGPAHTPEPPYYAVIFVSQRNAGQETEYGSMADRMYELAADQPGFLGVDSVRGADGLGITVSYWQTEADIAHWRAHAEHRVAQQRGRADWYESYDLRVCRVERVRRKPSTRAGAADPGAPPA